MQDALTDAVVELNRVDNLRTDYALSSGGMKALACNNAYFKKTAGVAVFHKGDCGGDGIFKFNTVEIKFVLDLHAADCVDGYKLNALSVGTGKALFKSFFLIV